MQQPTSAVAGCHLRQLLPFPLAFLIGIPKKNVKIFSKENTTNWVNRNHVNQKGFFEDKCKLKKMHLEYCVTEANAVWNKWLNGFSHITIIIVILNEIQWEELRLLHALHGMGTWKSSYSSNLNYQHHCWQTKKEYFKEWNHEVEKNSYLRWSSFWFLRNIISHCVLKKHFLSWSSVIIK